MLGEIVWFTGMREIKDRNEKYEHYYLWWQDRWQKKLSDLLSNYGEKKNYEFTITEYESGEQLCEEQSALEACQLLFLDINMQGMDGLKTAMRIKEKYPKLPVV